MNQSFHWTWPTFLYSMCSMYIFHTASIDVHCCSSIMYFRSPVFEGNLFHMTDVHFSHSCHWHVPVWFFKCYFSAFRKLVTPITDTCFSYHFISILSFQSLQNFTFTRNFIAQFCSTLAKTYMNAIFGGLLCTLWTEPLLPGRGKSWIWNSRFVLQYEQDVDSYSKKSRWTLNHLYHVQKKKKKIQPLYVKLYIFCL